MADKKRNTLFGSYTARSGDDSAGIFQQDFVSFGGNPSVFALASRTTTIAGRGPFMDARNEGTVTGLDGMMPHSGHAVFNSAQPGGPSFAGSGGAGSFATIVAKGAKG